MSNVMKPGQNDSVSVRNIPADDRDREVTKKAFREQKEIEHKHKEERFARIREARKRAQSGGRGINIEIS